ncbi:MAG: 2-isopropylmalate synthase [Candidatus Hydrogenedentes bacterium]|nr:2-isopropylmalate synthase [Candidatus Hydrogenedentota bacterium]
MYESINSPAQFEIGGTGERPPVRIFDTTLRDGEQTPGVHLRVTQKVAIAERLERLGVATIEAGFPVSSPGDFEAVARIARTVREVEVAALARCCVNDIDAAVKALSDARTPVVHLVLGTSDIHLEKKLGMTRADAVRAVRESVAYARKRVERVEFSLEDATRTERPFLRQIVDVAVEHGASRINIPDTVGRALPGEFGALIDEVVQRVGKDIIVSAHCHNDLGMATANTVAAVLNGARQVEVTVNGIGERAGNAALEEVCAVLAVKGIAQTGVDLTQLTELSRYVAEETRVPVQPNRAIVGANAFAHSSGIHQDGVIKAPENYECLPPAMVGASGHRFVFTARSGRSAIAHRARTSGRPLGPDQLDAAYRRFIVAADRADGAVSDDVVDRIIDSVLCEGDAENVSV